jgi:hypothetical protein
MPHFCSYLRSGKELAAAIPSAQRRDTPPRQCRRFRRTERHGVRCEHRGDRFKGEPRQRGDPYQRLDGNKGRLGDVHLDLLDDAALERDVGRWNLAGAIDA